MAHDSTDQQEAAIRQVLAELERHVRVGVRAGHYKLELSIRALSRGAREVVVAGAETARYSVPAPAAPLFDDDAIPDAGT
jgi:hypothetical protein